MYHENLTNPAPSDNAPTLEAPTLEAPTPEAPPSSSEIAEQRFPHDPTVPPKSLLRPGVLDVKHTYPVALLHLRSYYHPNLEFFLHFAYHAALALNIPLSHPARLPTTRSLFTVPKAPFIFKKAQENFERKTHKRAVKVWDTHPDVLNIWLRYLEEHMMPGVGMRVVRWERCVVGIGEARLKEVGGVLRNASTVVGPSVGEQVRAIGEKIIQQETEAANKALGTKA
ncbi:37S ribosomal protein [Ceratobasidium theobromae]|uniref:37S ribosomal protein n=1 Tax=Ceratobasidium theobromae TaxID=1582974 RepID=A0A5N5QFV9_9AGAM|nr:37S ribosomal protein [Ceratobasidium theobromae]